MNVKQKDREIAVTLKALAHPVRVALVRYILKTGPQNVKSLYTELGIPQSTVSQHLCKLRQAEVLKQTRKGLEMYYEIVNPRIETILEGFLYYLE